MSGKVTRYAVPSVAGPSAPRRHAQGLVAELAFGEAQFEDEEGIGGGGYSPKHGRSREKRSAEAVLLKELLCPRRGNSRGNKWNRGMRGV